jgi:predicted dehydrogenase
MTSQARLAIVGSGEIAGFHVAAARRAGFVVEHVASRPNSATAKLFGQKFEIPNVWSEPEELIRQCSSWDAIILAVSTEAMVPLLELAIETGKPILAEKPVGLTSVALTHLVDTSAPVLVGFNRRFYTPVQAAKDFIESGGPCLMHLELPEEVRIDQSTGFRELRSVRLNSVHGFDLVNYLASGLTIVDVHHVQSVSNRMGGVVVLRSARGDLCSISANWNAPANFSLAIDRDGERFELRPLEYGAIYRGMRVVEPTTETPIRKYLPQRVTEIMPDIESINFKPGFVAQCRALVDLTNGESSPIAANLSDAKFALEIAESIMGND